MLTLLRLYLVFQLHHSHLSLQRLDCIIIVFFLEVKRQVWLWPAAHCAIFQWQKCLFLSLSICYWAAIDVFSIINSIVDEKEVYCPTRNDNVMVGKNKLRGVENYWDLCSDFCLCPVVLSLYSTLCCCISVSVRFR